MSTTISAVIATANAEFISFLRQSTITFDQEIIDRLLIHIRTHKVFKSALIYVIDNSNLLKTTYHRTVIETLFSSKANAEFVARGLVRLYNGLVPPRYYQLLVEAGVNADKLAYGLTVINAQNCLRYITQDNYRYVTRWLVRIHDTSVPTSYYVSLLLSGQNAVNLAEGLIRLCASTNNVLNTADQDEILKI